MNIQVRVMSAAALAKLKTLEAASMRAAGGVGAVGKQASWGLPFLSKWGNQVQWAGRQLMYNFTLPIALAMGAAAKFALENEKAMVRVQKVYGDGSKQFRKLSQTEIPALAKAFEALSSEFAVNQAQVINIAGDWAAAGASGVALAKSVKLTLETMVLGELDAADATRQLIAIQAQYGFSIGQLSKTIDILNMVENQTGASMKDLMDGMSRAAGVARVAGIDVEHLSAMMAALVPATGTAATAGNALKTIISRLMAPTEDAVTLLREMGIETNRTAWASLNGGQRIQELADHFEGLSDAQKANMASVIGSRWQFNRLVVLLKDVNNEQGYYQKALKSVNDEQKVFHQRQKELNQVLTSNPQMIKQAWVVIQNAMAEVIVPLLPFITYLASQVARLAQKFADLNGPTQKWILAGLVFIAIIGPIARYVGSVTNLVGLLTAAFHFSAKAAVFFGRALVWPFLGLVRLMALPFAKFGLMMTGMGKAGAAASLVLRKGFGNLTGQLFGVAFLNPIKFAMAKMKVLFLLGISSMFGPAKGLMGAAMKGFTVPVLAAWRSMTGAIAQLWQMTLFVMQTAFAGFGNVMRQAFLAFGTGFAAGFKALQTAVLIGWKAFQEAMIALQWFATMSIRVLQLGMVQFGKTLFGGLAALAKGAGTAIFSGLRGLGTGLLAFFTKIPGLLFGVFRTIPGMLVRLIPLLFRVLTGPWGLAISAILGIAYAFRDKIAALWQNIVGMFGKAAGSMPGFFQPVGAFFQNLGQIIMDAFWALPAGVRDAMITVLTIIRDAAVQAYEWLSYLNPFATHSPSLVSQVTKGMDTIGKQYNRAGKMGEPFKKAHDRMKSAIAAQEAVVERWKNKLDAANKALDAQQDKLDTLRDKLDAVQSRYDAHKDSMENFASAPIKGMGKFDEALFANEIAQKKLQLQMKKWEQANGPVEDLRSRLDALYGDIERLRGRAEELRMKGAGSDVLGPINAQIKAMEAQAASMTKTVQNSPIDKMQQQLDKLTSQGEILQLQRDIKFDPLTHQIENLANSQKELSYGTIVKGIKDEKAAMDALQPRLTSLTNAVQKQEAVVKRYQNFRDSIQDRYDAENDKLSKMKEHFDKLTKSIDAAEKAHKKLKKSGLDKKAKGRGAGDFALSSFRGAAGGNFADVGGKAKIGREGGLGDQSAQIQQFTEDSLNDMNSIFGGFDMFEPLKKKWRQVWGWLKENVGPVVAALGAGISSAVQSIGNPFSGLGGGGFGKGVSDVFDTVADVARSAFSGIKDIMDLFAPDIKRIWNALVDAGKRIWKEIGPELAKFGKLWAPLGKAIKIVWRLLKPLIALLGGALLLALKIVAGVISRTLGPVLDFIIDTFKNIIKVVRGVIELLVGLFTGDWKLAWQGAKDIVSGVFGEIWAVIKGSAKIIWGVVSGIVTGIVEFFKWLWDKLVGHSIIPDIIHGILKWFGKLIKLGKWVWDHVLKPIVGWFQRAWERIKIGLRLWWTGVKKILNKLFALGRWVWDNILKPVFTWFGKLWQKVRAGLALWWAGIKSVWNVLKRVGKWIWDNVLVPVINRIKDLWTDRVKPELSKWWDRIKSVWSSLKNLGSWVKNNVMDPVLNKIKSGWTAVKNWLVDSKDILLKPVQGVVNAVISAVNTMIRGLNKISDVLPGISFHIDLIPKFAQGGSLPSRRVGGGFLTNTPRAIVGEGKGNWPEFVIPTDPTHRRRATELYGMAGQKLGISDTAARTGAWGDLGDKNKVLFANGGILGTLSGLAGSAKNLVKGSASWIKGSIKTLASAPFKAFKSLAQSQLNRVGWTLAKGIGTYGLNKVMSWVGAADKTYEKKAKSVKHIQAQQAGGGHWSGTLSSNARVRRAQQFAMNQVGKPYIWGGVGPGGYDCSGFMSAITNVIRGNSPYSRVGATASFPWGGFGSGTGVFTIGSTKSYAGSGIGHMAGTLAGMNVESRGGNGPIVGNRARGWNDSGFSTHAHLIGLANGAIVRATRNGTLARLGEGGRDEAVTPLPRGWRNNTFGGKDTGGDTIIQINGNLEFPNIRSGDDAEAFVKNLEILAKD